MEIVEIIFNRLFNRHYVEPVGGHLMGGISRPRKALS